MGKKKPQQHPSAKFVEEVSRKAIEPELSKQIKEQIQALGNQIDRKVSQSLSGLYIRQAVLEDLVVKEFGISPKKWAKLVVDKEDEGLGYKESKKAAAKGDLVRGTLSVRTDPKGDFGPSRKISLFKLAEEYSLLPAVENKIVGMKKGETKTVSVDASAQKTTEDKLRDGEAAIKLVEFKVTVDRVSSEKPKKEEAPSGK